MFTSHSLEIAAKTAAHEAHIVGGATVNVETGHQVIRSTGYVVALGGQYAQIVDNFAALDDEELAAQLVAFCRTHVDAFSHVPTYAIPVMRYLGVWANDGALYVDVVEIHRERAEAIAAGQAHDQIAIFDLATSTEIATGGKGSVVSA
jgi:hypothetical protein